jgi:DNA repair exonuclease SbcCD ATPase subunit
VITLLASGCVTTGAYDKKVSELEKLRADDSKAHAERERALQTRVQELESELAAKAQILLATSQERDELKKQLDDGTALVGELKSRLESSGRTSRSWLVKRANSRKGWRTPRAG